MPLSHDHLPPSSSHRPIQPNIETISITFSGLALYISSALRTKSSRLSKYVMTNSDPLTSQLASKGRAGLPSVCFSIWFGETRGKKTWSPEDGLGSNTMLCVYVDVYDGWVSICPTTRRKASGQSEIAELEADAINSEQWCKWNGMECNGFQWNGMEWNVM